MALREKASPMMLLSIQFWLGEGVGKKGKLVREGTLLYSYYRHGIPW